MSASTALYWGLPSHGVCLKRCRACRVPVLVRTLLRGQGAPLVVFFDENPDQETGGGLFHEHQPDPMWVWRWAEYVTKQRTAASGSTRFATDRGSGRGGMSTRDMARTKGTRVRGTDNAMRDCPFVEMDSTGEHDA